MTDHESVEPILEGNIAIKGIGNIVDRSKWNEVYLGPEIGDLAIVGNPSIRNGWLIGRIFSTIK